MGGWWCGEVVLYKSWKVGMRLESMYVMEMERLRSFLLFGFYACPGRCCRLRGDVSHASMFRWKRRQRHGSAWLAEQKVMRGCFAPVWAL